MGAVGAPVDWMLVTAELLLEMLEGDRDSGGEVAWDVDVEVGA